VIYLLDGYNILFFYEDSKGSFRDTREQLISSLQSKFKELGLTGCLIFDGAHKRDEESGRSYSNPLEIIYTPKGQNADSYLIEKIRMLKNPKEATLVTNDQGLIRQANVCKAHVQSIEKFIQFLDKKSKKPTDRKLEKETPHNLSRLLKIFLSRLDE
jgi:predicted RNA-binding protein with PIN domain